MADSARIREAEADDTLDSTSRRKRRRSRVRRYSASFFEGLLQLFYPMLCIVYLKMQQFTMQHVIQVWWAFLCCVFAVSASLRTQLQMEYSTKQTHKMQMIQYMYVIIFLNDRFYMFSMISTRHTELGLNWAYHSASFSVF